MDKQPAIVECDVLDKERLAVYRFHRYRWDEMLNGKDVHAICSQITHLLNTHLEFRTINAARRICYEQTIPQNGTVHSLIDDGFIARQSLGIRRLTEQTSGDRNRDVYSLRGIVDEIEYYRELITREVYVGNFGDSYSGGTDTIRAHYIQKQFDELSAVDSSARHRTDLIHPDVFRDLRKRLKSTESVRRYANKMLAHAAAPSNRNGELGLTFSSLREAYRDLIHVANFVSARVLGGTSHQFLPVYTCDPLEHFDSPLCPSSHMDELAHAWRSENSALKELERGP